MKPKPCPFCRSENVGFFYGHQRYVSCDDCGTDGPDMGKGAEAAIVNWNAALRREEEAMDGGFTGRAGDTQHSEQ